MWLDGYDIANYCRAWGERTDEKGEKLCVAKGGRKRNEAGFKGADARLLTQSF